MLQWEANYRTKPWFIYFAQFHQYGNIRFLFTSRACRVLNEPTLLGNWLEVCNVTHTFPSHSTVVKNNTYFSDTRTNHKTKALLLLGKWLKEILSLYFLFFFFFLSAGCQLLDDTYSNGSSHLYPFWWTSFLLSLMITTAIQLKISFLFGFT